MAGPSVLPQSHILHVIFLYHASAWWRNGGEGDRWRGRSAILPTALLGPFAGFSRLELQVLCVLCSHQPELVDGGLAFRFRGGAVGYRRRSLTSGQPDAVRSAMASWSYEHRLSENGLNHHQRDHLTAHILFSPGHGSPAATTVANLWQDEFSRSTASPGLGVVAMAIMFSFGGLRAGGDHRGGKPAEHCFIPKPAVICRIHCWFTRSHMTKSCCPLYHVAGASWKEAPLCPITHAAVDSNIAANAVSIWWCSPLALSVLQQLHLLQQPDAVRLAQQERACPRVRCCGVVLGSMTATAYRHRHSVFVVINYMMQKPLPMVTWW